MPTSSQSQILSVVDYQILHQQQQQTTSNQDETTKPSVRLAVQQSAAIESKRRQDKQNRYSTTGNKDDDDNQSPPPPNATARRRSSGKIGDGASTSRTAQRTDLLHMPVIDLNNMAHNERSQYRRSSYNNDDDDQLEIEYKLKQLKSYPTPIDTGNNNSSLSDLENVNDNENNTNRERRSSLLNENARRLLILGTIRPSKTFYKGLSDADVEHLMEYFRRMRTTNRKITSEEINQELTTKIGEYKPKIFFDSACVTKHQVSEVEKVIEEYAEKIRSHNAELVKLDNPIRFVIKQIGNDTPLATIPREYNDCFLTLVTRADPVRKSSLVVELVQDKLLEDIKANSLDISYFPGGVNYDVPRDEIEETGQMKNDTYQKLKKRLGHRTVRYFDGPPEKKPNAFLAILPLESSINIDHQRLLDCLYDRLKALSSNEKSDVKQRIISIEFVPLSCILNSNDTFNEFIIDCDTLETKQQLIDKPLKISSNKQSVTIELQSYDENTQREYDKYIKSEKYHELIKNHEEAIKRTSTTK